MDKIVPGRAARRRITRAYLLTDSFVDAWSRFGGPEGKDVDTEQIKNLLDLSAAQIITLATINLDFARSTQTLSSMAPGFPKPVFMQHPALFRLAMNEQNDIVKRADLMRKIETPEGRLEASVYFAHYRHDLMEDSDQSDEMKRRITACTNAITILMNADKPGQ